MNWKKTGGTLIEKLSSVMLPGTFPRFGSTAWGAPADQFDSCLLLPYKRST
jgi:hypothetical protein